MTRNTGGIFESFNARALEPHQVARTFVPPPHYFTLLKRNHSIMVGPRGSGKTTLLKMLQSPALEAWTHPDADAVRASVPFTGVFIPTDIGWSTQVQTLGHDYLDGEERRVFATAAFTTQVLRALVESMEHRVAQPIGISSPHRRVNTTSEAEAQFVRYVADKWHLIPRIGSIKALKLELTARLSAIHELVTRERLLDSDSRRQRLADTPCLHLHFLEAAKVAIEAFGDISGDAAERWALLFDELELAPDFIRRELFRSLRSVDERFLFKLSISPLTEDVSQLDSPTSPMPRQDYEQIQLWYPQKEQGHAFCEALLKSMLQVRKLPLRNAAELLGMSAVDQTPNPSERNYFSRRRRFLSDLFKELANKDSGFNEYLREKRIDPSKQDYRSTDQRAIEIRKIAHIAAIRSAFRSETSKGVVERSRKNPQVYTGFGALFSIVEGNPRWLIGIMSPLLDKLSGARTIGRHHQAAEIAKATSRFRAMLRTIPANVPGLSARGVLAVLDPIGEFLHEGVVRDDFTPDPPGSFVLDSNAPPWLQEAMGRALNVGAVVYVPDRDSQPVVSSLRGKRFRLSYILAPHYGIPLQLGRPISIGKILATPGTPVQPGLFEPSNE